MFDKTMSKAAYVAATAIGAAVGTVAVTAIVQLLKKKANG